MHSIGGIKKHVQRSPIVLKTATGLHNFNFHRQFLALSRPANSTSPSSIMAGKRKIQSAVASSPPLTTMPIPVPPFDDDEPLPKRRASQRNVSRAKPIVASTDPNKNASVLDAAEALRASPDADEPDERMDVERAGMDAQKQIKDEDQGVSLINGEDSDSALSDVPELESPVDTQETKIKGKPLRGGKKEKPILGNKSAPAAKGKEASKEFQFLDSDAEGDEEAGEEEIQAALSRPPPVNSDYLPLPWKGRLGYVRQPISAANTL